MKFIKDNNSFPDNINFNKMCEGGLAGTFCGITLKTIPDGITKPQNCKTAEQKFLPVCQRDSMEIEHQYIQIGVTDFSHFDGAFLAKTNTMTISVAM
jgi:hypothetical protein